MKTPNRVLAARIRYRDRVIADLRKQKAKLREKVDDLTTFFPEKHPARKAAEAILARTR